MSDEVKRYRAYLTRLTKWAAFEEANKEGEFNRDHLRDRIIGYGELEAHLGEAWEKRVFADAKMFEHSSGSFFSLAEGAAQAKSRPEWKGGPRPGEDVAGDTLRRLVTHVEKELEPPWKNYRLADERWDAVSRLCVQAMNHMRTRGIERPMTVLQERSFIEALRINDRAYQTVGLWFVDTRYYLEVYARLRAYARGEGELLYDGELEMYRPTSFHAKYDEERKELVAIEEEFTIDVALRVVRNILVQRKILGEQRQAA